MFKEKLSSKERIKMRLAKLLVSAGAAQFNFSEGFTFVSGVRSPIYIDSRLLFNDPQIRRRVIGALVSYIKEQNLSFDVIAGTAVGGVAPAALLAERLGVAFVYVRKEAKEYGMKKRVEGGSVEGRRVLLLEDLVSTGASSISAVAALRSEGAISSTCLSLTSYGFPGALRKFQDERVPFFFITEVSAIAAVALERGIISKTEHGQVLSWLNSQSRPEGSSVSF